MKKRTHNFRCGFFRSCGEGGIRTPGTLIEYASLANWWIKPLSHLSGIWLKLSLTVSKQDKSIKKHPLYKIIQRLHPTKLVKATR